MNENNKQRMTSSALPFLVTHWLSNYTLPDLSSNPNDRKELLVSESKVHNAVDDPDGQTHGNKVHDRDRESIARIRKAAAELADAFGSLGAFGTTMMRTGSRLVLDRLETDCDDCSSMIGNNLSSLQLHHATYQDVLRRWQYQYELHSNIRLSSSSSLLDSIVSSSSSLFSIFVPRNCLNLRSSSDGCGNHTTSFACSQQAMVSDSLMNHSDDTYNWTLPLLRSPTFITTSTTLPTLMNSTWHPPNEGHGNLAAVIRDTSLDIIYSTSQASRRHINLRFKLQQDILPQISMLLSSKKYHSSSFQQQQSSSERVLFQLQKRLEDLQEQMQQSSKDIDLAFLILITLWKQSMQSLHSFDVSICLESPSSTSSLPSPSPHTHLTQTKHDDTNSLSPKCSNSGILRSLMTRQYVSGASQKDCQRSIRHYSPVGRFRSFPLSVSPTWSSTIPLIQKQQLNHAGGNTTTSSSLIKTILTSRLSHCTTINSHLTFPIYCFCFDKTGNYFFTGADDHLVKAFKLVRNEEEETDDYIEFQQEPYEERDFGERSEMAWGGNTDNGLIFCTSTMVSAKMRQRRRRKFLRGAILVTTLRGHAGVINDMDVSSDNSMLATASEDSDVRIWTLHGSVTQNSNLPRKAPMGIPVAILRGHTGGANMVSWSDFIPYQLVSTGQDGLARIWDIRSAAILRSVNVLGMRMDYNHSLISSYLRQSDDFKKLSPDGDQAEGNRYNNRAGEDHVGNDAEKAEISAADGKECLIKTFVSNEIPLKTKGLECDDVVACFDTNRSCADCDTEAGSCEIDTVAIGSNVQIQAAEDQQENRQSDLETANLRLPEPLPVLGSFGSNGAIDHGVVLKVKMQHGELQVTPSSAQNDPDGNILTRSRRKAVSVICLSRCPIGGHFATGSDDGIGRIWADDVDTPIEMLDRVTMGQTHQHQRRLSPLLQIKEKLHGSSSCDVTPSKSNLLGTLAGHLNAITDIQYSHIGDRLLTASQKDGVIRVWSWGTETAKIAEKRPGINTVKFDNFRQILIRLTKHSNQEGKQNSAAASLGPVRRRGGSSTGTSTSSSNDVQCDIAIWTCDDSKIVTSQSCPLKATGYEAVAGSQIIYIWDSYLGHCLLGLYSAHSSACPVLISHPLDPTILVSAGGDGYVKIWDLETGRTIFSHANSLQHGPMESPDSEKGRLCGYLDGDFSLDGLNLILTDDQGRVTIMDAMQPAEYMQELRLNTSPFTSVISDSSGSNITSFGAFKESEWMKEQYFANDYYELFYDVNGYSVEQGSGQPPHLAPRAARCNHNGVPYNERIQDALLHVTGPMPLNELDVQLMRQELRVRALQVRKPGGVLERNIEGKRFVVTSQSLGNERSFNAFVDVASKNATSEQNRRRRSSAPTNRTSSGRPLSNNYRWRDYDDILGEEEIGDIGEMDKDDEEYRHVALDEISDDDSDLMSTESGSDGSSTVTMNQRKRRSTNASSPARRRRNNQNRVREHEVDTLQTQSNRTSTRHTLRSVNRKFRYEDPDSSDDEIEEYLSRNTTPSGEFVSDYTSRGHYFKMPNGVLHRNWVLRTENKSGYTGQKPYSPQVGDSVVYIARAHYDTLKTFPNGSDSSAPWKTWPAISPWPVVRCKIKDIRYRFPYEMYYRSRGSTRVISIVAILTLEITGVPSSSRRRKFPWPKPTFDSKTSRYSTLSFDVSIFETDEVEFVIPEDLYVWTISSLENNIREKGRAEGLSIISYYYERDEAEDSALVPYPGQIVSIDSSRDDHDYHFSHSGYNAVTVSFPHSENHESMCTWELSPAEGKYNGPPPHSLDSDQKKAVTKILDELEKDHDVKLFFSYPVDHTRYVDYLNMVEVPMDISFIRKRIAGDYYTNLLSFDADVRLIRSNCIKYNESDSDITAIADRMYKQYKAMFEDLKNSDLWRKEDYDTQKISNAPCNIQESESDESSAALDLPNEQGSNHASSMRVRRTTRSTSSSANNSLLAVGLPDGTNLRSTANALSLRRQQPEPTRRSSLANQEPPLSARGVRTSGHVDSLRRIGRDTYATRNETRISAGQLPLIDSERSSELTRSNGALAVLVSSAHIEPASNRRITRSLLVPSDNDIPPSVREPRQRSQVTRQTRSHSATVHTLTRSTRSSTVIQSNIDDTQNQENVLTRSVSIRSQRQPSKKIVRKDCAVNSPPQLDHRSKSRTNDSSDRQILNQRTLRSSSLVTTHIHVDATNTTTATRNTSPRRGSKRRLKQSSYDNSSAEYESDHSNYSGDRKHHSDNRITKPMSAKRSVRKLSHNTDDYESDGSGIGKAIKPLSANKLSDSARAKNAKRQKFYYDDDYETFESSNAEDTSPRTNRMETKKVSSSRTRNGMIKMPSVKNDESFESDYEEESYQSDSDESSASAVAQTQKVATSRKSSRHQSVKTKKTDSYLSDEDSFEPAEKSRVMKGKKKRPIEKQSGKKAKGGDLYYPQLRQWPDNLVNKSELETACIAILQKMHDLDHWNMFKLPVVESYPDIADDYLSRVTSPMDFQTIHDRISQYRKISELQQDLILTLRNCCTFNGENSEYWAYAVDIWQKLNEVFKETLEELGFELPRRW